MKRLFSYFKPHTGIVFTTILLKLLWTVAAMIIPYLLGYILDEVVPSCTADRVFPIFYWGGVMLLFAIAALILGITANRLASRLARDVTKKLRQDLFDRILALSARQVDAFTVPSLVARLSSDTYTTHDMINNIFRGAIHNVALFAGGLAFTMVVEPVLSLSLAILLPFIFFTVLFVSRRSIRLFRERQKKTDEMIRTVRDAFTGIRVIKALSKTNYEKEHFDRVKNDLSRSAVKAGRTVSVTKSVTTLFLNLGMALVIVMGAYRVAGGHTQPGQIISFMSYFTLISNATITISRLMTSISSGAASAHRVFEVIDTEPDLLLAPPEEKNGDAPFLEFRNVTFSYNKTLPTLKDISFSLKKGETLGIIGGTGSGKSTLLQLLLRFYDVDEGQIFLEGRDVRSIPKEDLHSRFGVVFQNDFLSAESISENIRFARPVNGKEVEFAAEYAQAAAFIRENEDGFNHELVPHGANLSGGQRQRLLIARALAAKPEILLLDDASSALDYKTDATLRQAIRENFSDTTTIIVAQRVSSVHAADLILVLEHGETAGLGKHDDLMEHCEIYQEIARSQMGELQG